MKKSFLGSLLDTQVKLSVVTFSEEPIIIHKFSDPQDRESVFERIEGIQPVSGRPSYAKAVQKSLNYFNENHREDARGLFLIVGNGENTIDSSEARSAASNIIRRVKNFFFKLILKQQKIVKAKLFVDKRHYCTCN